MLSAVVIHAGGDRMPGDGFFDLAANLGLNETSAGAQLRELVSATPRLSPLAL